MEHKGEERKIAPGGPSFDGDSARKAVIKVGAGRGFVIEFDPYCPVQGSCTLPRHSPLSRMKRLVVTAAHCLPQLPPAHAAAFAQEKTYTALLGSLGDSAPSIMTECLFVDPVADIAILGAPDGQVYGEEEDAFEALTDGAGVLCVSDLLTANTRCWLLSLDGCWKKCTVQAEPNCSCIWIKEAEGIFGGMSGSPILLDDGRAIGMICVSSGIGTETATHTEGGPNPWLTECLPGWLLRGLGRTKSMAWNIKRKKG